MAEDTKKFYGVKLTDATGKVYYTEVNVKQGLTHNINIQTHKPISSKFPYSTIIGKNNSPTNITKRNLSDIIYPQKAWKFYV